MARGGPHPQSVAFIAVFEGPTGPDGTALGGLERHKQGGKRPSAGNGTAAKTLVRGITDPPTSRGFARFVETPDAPTLHWGVPEATVSAAQVGTDDASAYTGIARDHETVQHIDSFGAMVDRDLMGDFLPVNPRQLDRRGTEFSGRPQLPPGDTRELMDRPVAGIAGGRLLHTGVAA